MLNRIKTIGYMYIGPLVCAIAFQVHSGSVKIDGSEVGFIGLFVSGFIFGAACEGIIMMVTLTIAVLSGRFE